MPASAETYSLRHSPWPIWGLATVIAVAMGLMFHAAIERMVGVWFSREEYSHGVLIPLLAAFLIWQRKDSLCVEPRGSWLGAPLVLFAGVVHLLGTLATLYVLQQYALLLAIYGLALALLGGRALRQLAVPLGILAFMIPLPKFLLQNFSAELQLVSSQIGVWFIRLFGISVFVEGNVIDLGGYRLQVAEACDGLRYLFPLMTLGMLMAYFFKARPWKRVVLFVSSIPITILMNSLRIGIIGLMVEHWGTRMAEGFLHDFQGWVVFMASAALLLAEIVVLARFGADARPWREVFALELPAKRTTPAPPRAVPAAFLGATAVLAACALGAGLLPQRADRTPVRESFALFPLQLHEWSGRRAVLDAVYLDELQLDDYMLADYLRGGSEPVNLYVAWYDSQRAGQSAHSPRSCLPGGGWQITALEQVELQLGAPRLTVNRVQIELGSQKQLMYYWFQQRGRIITNEYLVKWYLFWDSITRSRSDGALVRLVTPLATGESVEKAELRLRDFAANAVERLPRYVPD